MDSSKKKIFLDPHKWKENMLPEALRKLCEAENVDYRINAGGDVILVSFDLVMNHHNRLEIVRVMEALHKEIPVVKKEINRLEQLNKDWKQAYDYFQKINLIVRVCDWAYLVKNKQGMQAIKELEEIYGL